jgi:hypothetical protein
MRRAAACLLERQTLDEVAIAVDHLLAAGDWLSAANSIEVVCEQFDLGQFSRMEARFSRLPREVVAGRPGLLPVFGMLRGGQVRWKSAASDGGTMRQAQPLGVVTYPDVWRGVSIEYRASERSILKSTYTVAPSADASQIRLRYNLPVALQNDESLPFPFGRGYLSASAPIAWREIDDASVPVPVAFTVLPSPDRRGAGGEVGFRLGAYDPRFSMMIYANYPWHTFYGSANRKEGHGVAVDASSNIYLMGFSNATWGSPLHAQWVSVDILYA